MVRVRDVQGKDDETRGGAVMGTRSGLSKTTRFEVFKRDSFACQYCGAKAPGVVLQVDHIKPVAEGGTDDVINLTSSCVACNSGKGARELSDASVVEKQRRQLEELQERREQIDMMLDWQRGLSGIRDALVDQIIAEWIRLTPGWIPNENGKLKMKRWARTYSVDELFDAMGRAAETYIEYDKDGKITSESWGVAFAKIPKVASVRRAIAKEPWMDRIYHAANVLDQRFGLPRGIWKRDIITWMRSHHEAGVHEDDIFQGVSEATSFEEWHDEWAVPQ